MSDAVKTLMIFNPIEGGGAQQVDTLPLSGKPGESVVLTTNGYTYNWNAVESKWCLGSWNEDVPTNPIKEYVDTQDAATLSSANEYADGIVEDAIETANSYADSVVVGAFNLRGEGHDASGNTYPTTGGSGSGGAIKKGNLWVISVAGHLGDDDVSAGDVLYALVDSPAQEKTKWKVIENNFSYVPEDRANKQTSGSLDTSTTKYPANAVVKTSIEAERDIRKGDVWFVATNGSDTTGVGSDKNPYATFQKGIDSAGSADVVKALAGSFAAGFTIADGQSRIVMGEGCGNASLISGNVSFGETGSIYTILKQLDIRGKVSTTGLGGWRLEDCKLLNAGGNILEIGGTLTGNIVLDRCQSLGGNISITSLSMQDIQIKNGYYTSVLTVNSGIVVLQSLQGIGKIVLNGGVVICDNTNIIKDGSGVCISVNATATSGSAIYLINFNNLMQADGTFGKIVRTASGKDAPIYVGGTLLDNPSLHTLYTTPLVPIGHSGYSQAGYPTQTNYTAAADVLAYHLAGIDMAIGLANANSSRVAGTTKANALQTIYNVLAEGTPDSYTAFTDEGVVVDNDANAYYPSLRYEENGFHDGTKYKCVYSVGSSLKVTSSYAPDRGWSAPVAITGLTGTPHHPHFLYKEEGFSAPEYKYRVWYWNSAVSNLSISCLRTAESADCVAFVNDVPMTQDVDYPIITGTSGDWNGGTWGIQHVFENKQAGNTGSDPFNYNLTFYYDATTGTTYQTTGLAYSIDGIHLKRYAPNAPVLNRASGNESAWDFYTTSFGSYWRDVRGYHCLYTGGRTAGGFTDNFGIGYASSPDGLDTWTKYESNPLFNVLDGETYRDERCYTPSVVDNGSALICLYTACGSAQTGRKKLGLLQLPYASKGDDEKSAFIAVASGDWTAIEGGYEISIPKTTYRVNNVISTTFGINTVTGVLLSSLVSTYIKTDGSLYLTSQTALEGELKVLGV